MSWSSVFEALRYACCVHVVPDRTKTYAAPAFDAESSASATGPGSAPVGPLASAVAPTTIVSPETATEYPKRSSTSGFDALRYACCVHVEPERTYTYTAPEYETLSSASQTGPGFGP